MTHVVMFTDGACRGNPGAGGWGAILSAGDHERSLAGAERMTTNNRMELKAAIEGLKALKKHCDVTLYTDSQYVKKGITEWLTNWKQKGWKTAARKPVKNIDLWQQLDELQTRHNVDWQWVKGHAGIEGNEKADLLANAAIDELLRNSSCKE